MQDGLLKMRICPEKLQLTGAVKRKHFPDFSRLGLRLIRYLPDHTMNFCVCLLTGIEFGSKNLNKNYPQNINIQ